MVYASYDIDLPHQPSDGEIKEVIKQFNLTPAQQEQVFIETKKNLDEMYKNQKSLLPADQPSFDRIKKVEPKSPEPKGFKSKGFKSQQK